MATTQPDSTLVASVAFLPDRACVRFVGELDLAGAPSAEAAVLEAERRAPSLLEIDLRELQFLDSTGLRLLLRARERAQAAERGLCLRPGPRSVQRVFELTRTGEAFEFLS